MEISLPSLLLGGAGVGVAYFAYLATTKGLPAAWAWVKSKWTAASADVSSLKADFAKLESGVVATVQSDVAALKSRVAALEAHTGVVIPAPGTSQS